MPGDVIANYLPWLLSAITIRMTVLAGNKHHSAWLLGLVNQGLWLSWILITGTWGLIPMNLALWVVYARNHFKWIADREKGSEVPSDRPVTPKYTAASNGGHLLGRTSDLATAKDHYNGK